MTSEALPEHLKTIFADDRDENNDDDDADDDDDDDDYGDDDDDDDDDYDDDDDDDGDGDDDDDDDADGDDDDDDAIMGNYTFYHAYYYYLCTDLLHRYTQIKYKTNEGRSCVKRDAGFFVCRLLRSTSRVYTCGDH